MKNSPLSTSRRSAIQTTDSTRKGCRAKTAATKALGHNWAVIRHNVRNSVTAEAACSSRLVRWCPVGFKPNHWQSSMCDSMASGHQSPCGPLVKAQATFDQE